MAKKKLKGIKKAMSKTQMFTDIADNTGLTRKQVSSVFDELEKVIYRHVQKGAAGDFKLPGLLKIKTVQKPARKARKNVPNPFKPGEFMDVKAKPASTKIKVLPLKKLKDMV
jgi:nucleoid DNA-binding protein